MISPKVFEKRINDYLSLMIYGVFEDIEIFEEAKDKSIYQHYDNLIKDPSEYNKGLKNRFTISTEVKQFMYYMTIKYIEEIDQINIKEDDDFETIRSKLEDEHVECMSIFMVNLASKHKSGDVNYRFGNSLQCISDTSKWFNAQLSGNITGNNSLMDKIYDNFNTFLKTLSLLIGKLIWYHETSISAGLFRGVLFMHGLDKIFLDELTQILRPKISRAKKQTEGDEVDNKKKSASIKKSAIKKKSVSTKKINNVKSKHKESISKQVVEESDDDAFLNDEEDVQKYLIDYK